MSNQKPLGHVIVALGILSEAQVEDTAADAHAHGTRLGAELLRQGLLTEDELYRALAHQHGLQVAIFDELFESLDRTLLARVPRTYLEHARMLPIRFEGKTLIAAAADPTAPVDDLAHAFEAPKVETRLLTPTNFRRFWSIHDLTHTGEGAEPLDRSHETLGDEDVSESRLVALFEAILLDAIGARASDIHLEAYASGVRLRYRVDGRMVDVPRFEMSHTDLKGLVNVTKISSLLDITERRLPQGGRLRRRAEGATFDLRVQTQPTLHGENLVIRLLRQDEGPLSIEELGFPGGDADRFRRLLGSPQGLVLVVGPTGCGKSTTLYAGLQILAADATRKVITAEDPIEYAIEGIQQSAVRPDIGFAFANAMRAYVREDPDVILVGEIRDHETALEAIRASQTGHLVLSTLHCNDTVDAVQRLFDLGMHPNSIASELIAVMSQRLVRKICPECKTEVAPDHKILEELFPEGAPDTFPSFAGEGCGECDRSGTRGRTAAVEFLRVGEELRNGISRRKTVDELRAIAYAGGLKPIRNHLIELVLSGVTPLSEIPRTLSLEQMGAHRLLRDAAYTELLD